MNSHCNDNDNHTTLMQHWGIDDTQVIKVLLIICIVTGLVLSKILGQQQNML